MSNEAAFTLQVEGKQPKSVSSLAQIEQALRVLKPYGARTFAILEDAEGNFLQVAGGQVSACLERHDATGRWRAYLPNAHNNYKAPVTKSFGAGTLIVQPDEVLWIDDVRSVFEDFFAHRSMNSVLWRKLELSF